MSGKRWAALPVCAGGLLASACFVSSGECESSGVVIDPCSIPARIGQTRRLTARVVADPSAQVGWVRNDAIDAGFQVDVQGNTLQLIGKIGVGGGYRLRAESAADPSQFAEATITVGSYSFGYPPPPIQIVGTDGPPDYQGAVAAGGDRYYVAYANPGPPLARSGAALNFFVRQFELASSTPLAEIGDQFLTFGSSPVVPNVAADGQGNGYWVDWVEGSQPGSLHPQLLRLSRNGGQPAIQDLSDFCRVDALTVSPAGVLYFIGESNSRSGCKSTEIFRIRSFGTAPEAFTIPLEPFAALIFDFLAVDTEERLLLGDRNPDGTPPILRVLPDPVLPQGDVDPTFAVTAFFSVSALAVDALGVIYAASPQDHIPACASDDTFMDAVLLINSLGAIVAPPIECYEYQCPAGCVDTRCGTPIPFESIQSMAVGPDGRLRIVDDVTVARSADDPCQVTVRIVLIDP